jgi:hypothetical protein
MVVLVGHLHVANRLMRFGTLCIWRFFGFPVLFCSFGDGALKAIFAGHLKGVLHPFKLVFVLRDTFALFGIKKGGGALNYFGRLF